ncbi:restriction endonuclease [Streptomyces sp. Root63]|uniref:Eco57I restriction-modification methylase domain-containing protein n=1 Tax=unclassified Streptomyces TaxID=2593676 RepID=UPI0007010693|nr:MULTISPECIES: DNA methyltransferase [unclassified Streptomyces]KQX43892.1 restriction endonuclease [Streptomyces sp. Root1295]KRA34462.1 restriction endonuclease [Streptomyces sp. Root63]
MSATTRNQAFTAVQTVGGLLPADMLLRISEGKDVPGSKAADYGLPSSRSVRDEAERGWEYLKPLWRELRKRLPENCETGEPAADPTGIADSDWLTPLWRELGFGRLTAIGPTGITADSDTEKKFPVSHRWQHALIHQTPWNADLDKRAGGAGTTPAQSMLQECLNRTEAHLWGVLTNGRQVRLLRDSSALSTVSYVEFDLEAIFDGELFSEFVLLYRLLHASRFEVAEDAPPSACWLEAWRTAAIESGARALEHYRDGVQQALAALGTGFLRHPDNTAVRENLDPSALQSALLRLVYRLIFLFVAEDRGALLNPDVDERTRDRYHTYFSTARLRERSLRRQGTAHSDQYAAVQLVLAALGDEQGRPELGLPGLGGLFNTTDADAPLDEAKLSNRYFLEAVRHLARVRDADSARWRPADYRHMGAEELGSVYEALLELVPKHSATRRTFELVDRAGNDRKKTGSYYTPSALTETLLDSTLNPVIDAAVVRGEERARSEGRTDPADTIVEELLSLTVCDPACGSGHFLVGAARRIAKRVAAVRERNPEPTVEAVRHALHEVVARCVYGVDLNPMAVELAKVSLWLEAMEPGRPLGFLDAHIKHGNGLIGATPARMKDGIPDRAFKKTEGDDEGWAKQLLSRNHHERTDQVTLFDLPSEAPVANTSFGTGLRRITFAPARTLADVRRKEQAYEAWSTSAEYLQALHLADAWCAAFVWVKREDAPPAITHGVFRGLEDPEGDSAPQSTHDEIVRLREQYAFFHWHLEFPEVFRVPEEGAEADGVDRAAGWAGGFSCVVGNPPWDKVHFEDKTYFSVVEPNIAAMAGTARRTRIEEWEQENPAAGKRYRNARRTVKGLLHFAGSSSVLPLCARALTVKGVTMLQMDQLFAERMATVVAPEGRFGLILPTAIATAASAQHLFSSFTQRGAIACLYDFENRRPKSPVLPQGGKWFESVDSRYKFCLLTVTGRAAQSEASRIGFFLSDITDLEDTNRVFALDSEDLARINPNTGTLPVFRTQRDADITASVYRRMPVLWNEGRRDGNPWGLSLKRLFDMTDDSDLFRSREQLEAEGWGLRGNVFERDKERMLPLYEAKMVDFFNHRAADVVKSLTAVNRQNQPKYLSTEELRDPARLAQPLNWIQRDGTIPTRRNNRDLQVKGLELRLAEEHWDHDWLCGWCDITSSTNERTAIPAFLPRTAVNNKFSLMLPRVAPPLVAALVAAQSSLCFDFISRQKLGGVSMGLFIWKQLPVPTPTTLEPHLPFLLPRVLELVYTAYDMTPLARDLGDEGEPFGWDEARRAQLRAELDAYFFHLYGISAEDTDYILETFQSESGGLKNNEIGKFGEYRTKRLVLTEYERMATAGLSLEKPLVDGETYTSPLTPPPGQGPRHPA